VSEPTVTAVVLAYGDEPWLERSVDSLLASEGVEIDVVVVDNGGAKPELIDALGERPGVQLVRPGENLGFAGGCNVGAAKSDAEFLAFVNQDASVEPDALAALVDVAARPGAGLATGSVRLAEDPELLMSAGNDIHYLGFSWTGAFRERAADHAVEHEVTGASGTALVLRRLLFDDLGGFAEPYFAYHEDAELSLRCWQRGLSVVFTPAAVVHHRYEFSRNARKYYLVERNRLLFVLTLWETRTLALLAPALLVAEAAVTLLALRGGWFHEKVAGWTWVLRNWRWVRRRRALLQGERVRRDGDLAPLMVTHMDPGNVELPGPVGAAGRVLDGYWRAVRPALGRSKDHTLRIS